MEYRKISCLNSLTLIIIFFLKLYLGRPISSSEC
jgi:hypothetical protein